MASKPESSLTNAPNFTHVVMELVADKDAKQENAGVALRWFTTVGEAVTYAKEVAEANPFKRYSIFECSQVIGCVQKVETLFSRRG